MSDKLPFTILCQTLGLSSQRINDKVKTRFKMGKLISLDLSREFLTELPVHCFDPFEALEELYLEHNHLHSLNSVQFKNLKNLRLLNLSFNNLQHLPKGLLSECKKLEVLALMSNQLRYLPEGFIDHLQNLRFISLAINHLPTILSLVEDDPDLWRQHLESYKAMMAPLWEVRKLGEWAKIKEFIQNINWTPSKLTFFRRYYDIIPEMPYRNKVQALIKLMNA